MLCLFTINVFVNDFYFVFTTSICVVFFCTVITFRDIFAYFANVIIFITIKILSFFEYFYKHHCILFATFYRKNLNNNFVDLFSKISF